MGRDSVFLRQLFEIAVSAVSPRSCMADVLDALPERDLIVIGAGKAAAAMALEMERHKRGDVSGIVIVPYGHGLACEKIEVVEAAHPVPDSAGVAAARRMLELVSGLSESDHVLCLLSGGGSSLMTSPIDGITLENKQSISRSLLKSGAPIGDVNCVRKQLSAIKGGRLAARCWPARIRTIIISDVPGNDVSVIASGPTVHDTTTPDDARAVLVRYEIDVPESVKSVLENVDPVTFDFDEDITVIATSDTAIAAAAEFAGSEGYEVMMLGDLEGDARDLANHHASLAKKAADGISQQSLPLVIFSGGETTLKVTGTGRGGRNGEYALALARALDGHPKISALACDTDGIDGAGDNAGCVVLPDTLARASGVSLDAAAFQANNDSYSFFAALGDLVITGPTRTNVNDFRAIIIER